MGNITIESYTKKLVIHQDDTEIVLKLTPSGGTAICQMINAAFAKPDAMQEYNLNVA
jgi:hypothetical protein